MEPFNSTEGTSINHTFLKTTTEESGVITTAEVIFKMVHQGQNCLIRGLELDLCFNPTTFRPDLIKTGSYIGVISYKRSNIPIAAGLVKLNYGAMGDEEPQVREEVRAGSNNNNPQERLCLEK
ncbi:unnamed protein product [Allacma fusca]|uniref:Uncharacterized protein n=1 Tax=Allacma fusca TaxID=39272 RepID=A0A8J2L4F6_9HEXA|nr:unnamed protein product [Allacma fusca]